MPHEWIEGKLVWRQPRCARCGCDLAWDGLCSGCAAQDEALRLYLVRGVRDAARAEAREERAKRKRGGPPTFDERLKAVLALVPKYYPLPVALGQAIESGAGHRAAMELIELAMRMAGGGFSKSHGHRCCPICGETVTGYCGHGRGAFISGRPSGRI